MTSVENWSTVRQQQGTCSSLWNLNFGLRNFRHGISIIETCCQLSWRKVDAQSVINWTVVGQLSWQYLRAPTLDRCSFYHNDRQTLSTARFRFAGQLTTAYTVVMLLTFILSIPSPRHSFIPALKPFFLQILPTAAFLFLFQDCLHGFPRLFTDTSEHIRFYVLVFLFSTFWLLVPCGRSSRLTPAFERTLK